MIQIKIFKKKVKPLILSFTFALMCILIGQILLKYQKQSITLDHCKKLNTQNIFIYNRLEKIKKNEYEKVLKQIQLPFFCNYFLEKTVDDEIKSIELSNTNYENKGYILRLYSDSFNQFQNRRSKSQGNFLIILLLFNVFTLISQSIFLLEDSKDIDIDSD